MWKAPPAATVGDGALLVGLGAGEREGVGAGEHADRTITSENIAIARTADTSTASLLLDAHD
jgi:hypothetical protein